MATDNTDQSGGSGVVPLRRADFSLRQPPDPITRTLVTGHFQDKVDGKLVWREYTYTVVIGDREFIERFEQARKR